jgi:circadian clock protein KaiB
MVQSIKYKMTIMGKEESWELWLYIAGQTPKSILALENITRYSKEHIKDNYTIEVIDLIKSPQLAEADEIFAIPTLVRKIPKPIRRIIGDLSNKEKVLLGLNIRPIAAADGK